MKSSENTLRRSHSVLPVARLSTPLVDLLLDGLSLLIRDDTPGIAITTFQELGDALAFRHDPALQRELPQEEFTLG
jgi:hypothetical protein